MTMPERSLAERLGYKATDKLLMIHADDVGMCHSVNVATTDAMERGVVTSASIMVPCPWFPEIAEYCRKHPEKDFGIHLTLTSEWQHYRWRPVSPIDKVPGLLDKEGFIHRDEGDTARFAKPSEVEREIRAQIARAREFGIKPTHIDSHMGTLFAGVFYPTYTKVGRQTGLMPMVLYPTPERVEQARKEFGLADPMGSYRALKKQNFVFLDTLKEGAEGRTLETRRKHYWDALRALKPGVTEFIVHLSLDDAEIRHITGNWEARWNEYQIMTDPRTRALIDELGIKLIGYRELSRLAFQPDA
jgi:chitin disaccharide deacetylase